MPTLCTLKVHGCAPCRLDVDCFQTTGLGCASSQTARPGASVSARTSGEARRASAPVSGGWFSWSASFWTSASSLSSSRSKAFSSRSSSPASDASPPRSFCPCWPRAFSRLRSGWRFFCSLRSLSEPLPSAAETWRGIENARERTAMPVSNAMFFIKDCCEHGGRDLLQGWEQDDAGNRCSVERVRVRQVRSCRHTYLGHGTPHPRGLQMKWGPLAGQRHRFRQPRQRLAVILEALHPTDVGLAHGGKCSRDFGLRKTENLSVLW